jgi:hypothetical protein
LLADSDAMGPTGRSQIWVLSRTQYAPPGQPPIICRLIIGSIVVSQANEGGEGPTLTNDDVEFGQYRFAHITREPLWPGCILISVLLAVRVKS